MPKLSPKIENWLLNPPAGSKAALAKEFGVDLTLIIGALSLTPNERVRELQSSMQSLEKFSQQAKSWREKQHNKSRIVSN